ncbi:MetJ regulator of methionine regulon [Pseudoalteromonas haloplanktis]|uniref:MetJ regulator of methionine regulon n=1 Tax=Pseudoalteromonas haloplanktis TaxID=228 RepID=A0ABU1B7W0_PSEHA|nr:MetJ regulator of methionine regulon [Pseudoalteromonas haloplanktis]MDQ9090623.1 MetJ regulator of methionine regulon [Pseudoalteromonas haloplanktis]
MEKLRLVVLIIGCICILFGYFRFITDEQGNVNLQNYRFTGGLGLVLIGIVAGTHDLFSRYLSKNALSALAIYTGLLLFYLGFSI